jgi:hypothetical protein
MPRVGQAHLDARRQQIVDAARARFAAHGFARTSMADIVAESGLSIGAIYRYSSKDRQVPSPATPHRALCWDWPHDVRAGLH